METPDIQPASAQPAAANAGAKKLIISTIIAAGSLTWLADFLFWEHAPGISIAILCLAIAGIALAIQRRERHGATTWIATGLLLAASCATALEISFTNVSVLVALLAVITGECWYGGIPAGWARWAEPLVAWIAAPARWPWLFAEVRKTGLDVFAFNERMTGKAARSLRIAAPAMCLALIFSMVFGFGNAVFGDMLTRAGSGCTDWVQGFDFSTGRLLFWAFSATLALAFVHPRIAPPGPRAWARKLPQLGRPDVPVAIWQSRLVLIVLNALFFMVNTIDVFYLWWRAKLPAGVTFSEFVHHGVYGLIVAVLLSALVIAVIFQQEEAVKRGRFLKACAVLWIAQNLVLIAGVFLRLKLYVQAYELSEERVYVGCFLLLVVAGFALLAWHVARNGSLNALVFRNAMATFALFFALQFTNVAGWVAHYNVACWKRKPQRTLDIAYLSSLGPDAWPALVEAASANNDHRDTIEQARTALRQFGGVEVLHLQTSDWRSWQARRDSQSAWLVAQSAKYPPANAGSADQDGSGSRSLLR